MELVIAMAMITIIFAVVLPQFALIRNSWDAKQRTSEALQNGRVLTDHISRNLSKAKSISAVSTSSVPNGYIQFVANDSNTYRYDIGTNNYVEYGRIGNLADLAGPVSLLRFTCYDVCDLDTPITDVNSIRTVKVDFTITNSASVGQNKTFTTWVYLRTNSHNGGLVGCWKFDETSGLTAADSSGSGNNGTLVNMTGNEWTTGVVNGALNFNGVNNYRVDCGNNAIFNITNAITLSAWIKTNDSGNGQHNPYVVKGDYSYGLKHTNSNNWECYVKTSMGWGLAHYPANSSLNGVWHHLAGTYNGSQLKLYVDGVLQATTSYTGAIGTDTSHVCIGEEIEHTDRDYNGVIDDVRIYNRALSADEIANLANILRYRDFNEAKAGPYSPVITISRPSSTNAGDLLIAAVATDGDTSGVIASPGGWTLIDRGAYNGEVTLAAWWKIAGASEPASYQFTWWGSSKDAYGWIMRFTGHDPTNPIHNQSANGQGDTNTPTSPAVTTTVNDCLILRLGAFDDDGIVVDSPGLPGHTAITMDESHSTEVSVTYGGYADANLATDGTSITIPKPAGTAQGNYLVAAVAADGTASTMGWASSSGWNSIFPSTPMAPSLGIWYKTAGASEPASYTFSWSTPEQAYGWIMRLTGGSPTLVGFQPDWKTSSTPTCLSVTPSGPFGGSILILRLGAFSGDAITVGNPGLPSDHNSITMNRSNTGSGSVSGGAGYKQQAGVGPSGTADFSLTSSKPYETVSIPIWSGVYNNTCSGGAGYVRQSAAGSSGTSTFSLGSPNEARMLTIAIAPADATVHDCCGDLRP
jgi:type II secretory pathway pseudopilin PulG